MAGYISEFFGYRSADTSVAAKEASDLERCPIIDDKCEKTFSNGVISGVCSVKPIKSGPVICCPIRLYAENYKILKDITLKAFEEDLDLVPGKKAIKYATDHNKSCIAVFGKKWGGELRISKKSGPGGYFIDWILAKLSPEGKLVEFIAIEVQTIDTTGTYRDGYQALKEKRETVKTTVGLNWENVSKRILPQLIYKGQVLQRESLCRKGLFFVCPEPVFERIMDRLGGQAGLVRYALQPASISFVVYNYNPSEETKDGTILSLTETVSHSTTVYKVQEAFNNVTLPDENVYRDAILKALVS